MWRDVVEISRLKNLILASITVPLGAHIALSGEWSSDTVIQIFIQACSVIFFMASGNIVNDIYDLEIDTKAHPERVLPSGRMSISTAKKLTLGFGIFSFILMSIGFALNQSWYVVLIWFLAFLLMISYDMGWATKQKGIIGNVVISLLVAAVILYGGAAVSSLSSPLLWYASTVAFFANLGREIIKDCEDMESDFNRETLPKIVGLEKARMYGYVSVLVSLVLLYIPHWKGPLTFGLLPLQIPAILMLITLNGPLMKGDDYIAQKRVRLAMLFGLLGFAVAVNF